MFEISRDLARSVRTEFLRVLDTAALSYEQGEFFLPEEEKFIRREVERKLYEAKLPNGGPRERRWVERLRKLALDRDWEGAWRASVLAQKFTDVEGRYYVREAMSPRTHKKEYEWVQSVREAALSAKEYEKAWFAKMLLDGPPKMVSDFRLECLFLVQKPDGNMDRLIRLVNVRGESTRLLPMDATAFHAPAKFREFCLNKGNFDWAGNERDLQALQEDVGRAAAWRTVKQIVSFGWHPLERRPGKDGLVSGLWFFDDCVIDPAGRVLLPDEDNIYWHGDQGFIIEEFAREGVFLQGRPKMRPLETVGRATAYGPAPGEEVLEMGALAAFYGDLCLNLQANLGPADDCSGQLVIGSMLAYAAAPEIYDRKGSFGSLWVHGLKGSGKTTLCRVLMALFGLRRQSGLDLNSKQVTAIGLAQSLEQNANLPVWADEFRQYSITDDKLTLLRSGYERTTAAKFTPDGVQRAVNTNFLVSGETTTSDAATRSRFVHVQVSASGRQGSEEDQRARMEWFNTHRDDVCFVFRHVLQHRAEFVRLLLDELGAWEMSAELAAVESRVREVYGAAYAAFVAFNRMVPAFKPAQMAAFRRYLITHCEGAATDVSSEVNIAVFWTDLITAFKAGAIPLSCFRLESECVTHPPGAPIQSHWYSHVIYMDPDQTIMHLKMQQTKIREPMALRRNDLRDQMSKQDYWVPWVNGKQHTKRFGRGVVKCWGISVDRHPLGYQPCSDEEVLAAGVEDPRKGPLFEIVAALLDRSREQNA